VEGEEITTFARVVFPPSEGGKKNPVFCPGGKKKLSRGGLEKSKEGFYKNRPWEVKLAGKIVRVSVKLDKTV